MMLLLSLLKEMTIEFTFNYEPYLCNGCHDLMQKAMNFDDVAIVSIKENDYRIHFFYMRKDNSLFDIKFVNLFYFS